MQFTEFFPRLAERQQAVITQAYLEGLWGWPSPRVDGYLKADLSIERVLAERLDAPRRCVRGTACGNACIAPGKTCRIKGNPQKLARLKQLLALPAAGQSSSKGPGGARPAGTSASGVNKPPAKPAKPESIAELKAGVFKAFGVSSERELKNSALFRRMYQQGDLSKKTNRFVHDLSSKSGWKQLYRENVAVPRDERNLPDGPRIVNGIDVTKNFRPWAAFNLDPGKATTQDIKRAFLQLAKKHHPDAGGDPATFERLKKMRDTLLALRA
jgi:hypothetical protein